MKKHIRISLLALFTLSFIFSCSNNPVPNAGDTPVADSKDDELSLMRNYICGLWSYDSANILNNEGYYFKPDGTVDFVASEYTGDWKIVGTDSIMISYSFYSESGTIEYQIKSLTAENLTLADGDGEYIFRKVPFGMNDSEILLNGYHGSLKEGETREYTFDLPSAKKIRIALKTTNQNMTMKVFDQFKELSATNLQQLQCIMVRSGKYKVIVSLPEKAGADLVDFDLKVFGN